MSAAHSFVYVHCGDQVIICRRCDRCRVCCNSDCSKVSREDPVQGTAAFSESCLN
jgi:hypothetical protein